MSNVEINTRICNIANAVTKGDLADALGFEEHAFSLYYEEQQMNMVNFGGPDGFYRGVKILEETELMIRNIIARTETEIPLATAEKFIDELTADYGSDFVQQLVRVFFQDDVTVNLDRNSLAKAISEAKTVEEFANITGLEDHIVRAIIAVIEAMEYDPHLLPLMSATAEFVHTAGQMGLYSM